MKTFLEYFSGVKHPRRIRTIRRGKAKQPSQPRESDWPPFVPEPPGTTTSTGVAEEQDPNEPTLPRNATPLPKSDPPPKKKPKPSKSVSDSSSGFLGLSSGLPPSSSQSQ